MAFTKISQLLYTLNIFDGSSWHNFLSGLSGFIGRVLYRVIICGIGRIADICQLIFKKLAGISNNGVQFISESGTEVYNGDIVQYFVQSSAVRNILWSMLILAAVLLLISVFIATIKTEFAKDGNNNKRKVIKFAFRGLANFVLVPIICLLGLFIGNALLRAIDGATNPTGNQTTLSAQMFLAGGYNANRARQSENHGEGSDSKPYRDESFGARLVGQGSYPGTGNFGIFFDDTTGLNRRRAADKIDKCFEENRLLRLDTGKLYFPNWVLDDETTWYSGERTEGESSSRINLSELDIWFDGAFGTDIKVDLIIKNTYQDAVMVDEEGNINVYTSDGDVRYLPFNIYNVGLVWAYYDLRLGSFDYLVSGVCLIFCAFTLLVAGLGLVKRIFYLSVLFMISPGVCAIYPIDEGKSLERWRTEFIKYALSAYSTVIVLNLFLALLPTLLKMELFVDWSVDLSPLPIPLGLANYLARLLIVIGGLTFFKDATKQLSQIIGAADANGEGSDSSGKFAKNVKRVAGGVAIAGGATALAAKGIGKAVGGVASWYDKKAHKAMNDYNFYDPKKEKEQKDTDDTAKRDAQEQLAGGSAGTSTNSMNSVGGSGSSAGIAGGNAVSGSGSGSAENTAAERAAQNAEADAKKAGKIQKSLFNSAENDELRSKRKKEMSEHSHLYKAITAPGHALKLVHNANITRKIRGAFGGLTSAMGSIVTGKGKVSDAFNWSKGNSDFRKAEKERKNKVKEAEGKAAEARQHADEVADDRALQSSLHQGDREHMDEIEANKIQKQVNQLKSERSRLMETYNKALHDKNDRQKSKEEKEKAKAEAQNLKREIEQLTNKINDILKS